MLDLPSRPRRNRKSAAIRSFHRETWLSPAHFIYPLFVHDPRRGSTLHDWFSLDGNPDIDKTWTSSTLEYVDESGQVQLLTTALTPAVFALGEVRFSKQFSRLAPEDEERAVLIEDYVEMKYLALGDLHR